MKAFAWDGKENLLTFQARVIFVTWENGDIFSMQHLYLDQSPPVRTADDSLSLSHHLHVVRDRMFKGTHPTFPRKIIQNFQNINYEKIFTLKTTESDWKLFFQIIRF